MTHTITLSPHQVHTLKQALLTAEMYAKKLGAGAARDISGLHADIDLQIEHAQIEHPERYREAERTEIGGDIARVADEVEAKFKAESQLLSKEISEHIKAIEANYLLTNQIKSV